MKVKPMVFKAWGVWVCMHDKNGRGYFSWREAMDDAMGVHA